MTRRAATEGGPATLQMIDTPRLILRRFAKVDLDALTSLNEDPEVMRYIGDGKPQTPEQTVSRLNAIIEHYTDHGFGLWATIDKTSGAFVGFCGLQLLDQSAEVEVGYRLARRVWGRGIATEAARVCLQYGFEELALARIVAVVHPENLASQRVVEKIGLQYVKDATFYNTGVRYYAIAREQYNPR